MPSHGGLFVSVLFLVEVFVCCRRREKHVVSLSVCVLVVSFVKNPKIDGVVFNSVVYGSRFIYNTQACSVIKEVSKLTNRKKPENVSWRD